MYPTFHGGGLLAVGLWVYPYWPHICPKGACVVEKWIGGCYLLLFETHLICSLCSTLNKLRFEYHCILFLFTHLSQGATVKS